MHGHQRERQHPVQLIQMLPTFLRQTPDAARILLIRRREKTLVIFGDHERDGRVRSIRHAVHP